MEHLGKCATPLNEKLPKQKFFVVCLGLPWRITVSNVFCLTGPDGRLLDPSLQATILAKYSRSPDSAREILARITSEESDKFHDKWVVKFGHSSVAELATIPICMEGISIVASKVVESMQRGAFSEKSTRYQRFSSESFITPPGGPDTMKAFASRMYAAYDKLYEPMMTRCAVLMGRDPNDRKSFDRVLKARAFDSLRYLLPAGTGTNVACVLNFRDTRDLISTMLGHSNPEIQKIGEDVLAAASGISPVLMRHAVPNVFEPKIMSLGALNSQFIPERPNWYVSLDNTSVSQSDAKQFLSKLIESRYNMDWETFSRHMTARPEHLQVPKIFDTITLTFDILMDYGAFRDLQRHRKCEQFVEPLTTQYGFMIPDDIAGSDLESDYVSAMESVALYDDDRVIYDTDLFQYMIPMGYLHRSSFQMTMRELYYIVELRTRPHGHISYRRIAYKMYELARRNFPDLMEWCRAVEPTSIGDHG
jgi:thymidylate synthase ThyX